MTTNYTPPATETNEEEDIFTQAFTQSNDPASVATSAAQREYSRILAESRAQERSTQESYSDMYAKMKQSAFRRRQATPSRGFTGGMEAQQQATLSAAEMAELGALGRSQEQALRDIRTGRQSAASNAMIVGQQQADYASMLQDRAFATQQEIENIRADETLSDEAKANLLSTLGEPTGTSATATPTTQDQRVRDIMSRHTTGNRILTVTELTRTLGITREQARAIFNQYMSEGIVE